MGIKKRFECKICGWEGELEFHSYRDISIARCPKCDRDNLEEIKATNKFGAKKHVELIKQALLRVIDRYYIKHSKITVENAKLSLDVSHHGTFGRLYASRDFYPDVFLEITDEKSYYHKKYKRIIIECETGTNGLLKDEERLVAYNLLKIKNPDLAIILAVPSSLKGKIKKPEFFNDVWYFDIKEDNEVEK